MIINLKITQGIRLTREITVQVEADSLDEAIKKQNETDSPAWEDPRWIDHPDLMHEEVTEA